MKDFWSRYVEGLALSPGTEWMDFVSMERAMRENVTTRRDPGLQLLLIDDDAIFGKTMLKAAKEADVHLTHLSSVEDVERLPKPLPFDAAIVDYYLDGTTGVEAVKKVGGELPVILISGSREWPREGEDVPSTIRQFLHKRIGPRRILKQASNAARSSRSGALALSPATTELIPLPILEILAVFVALIILALATSHISPSRPHPGPLQSSPSFRWDAGPFQKPFIG